MLRRPPFTLLFLILALLVSGARAQTPRSGGTLNVAVSEPIPSLDMQRAITPDIVNVLINVYEPLVTSTFVMAYAILSEAALSFIGAGVPAPQPSWGN